MSPRLSIIRRARTGRLLGLAILALTACALPGCGPFLETGYGRARSASINGTGAFATILRDQGNDVRSTWELNDEVGDAADVIVRFAATPGPPPEDEADWYATWLDQADGRRLVYVFRDYDAEPDYWQTLLDTKGDSMSADDKVQVEGWLSESHKWREDLPDPPDDPADDLTWIPRLNDTPSTCTSLSGPWATGVDATAARLPRGTTLEPTDFDEPLLTCGDRALVAERVFENESRMLFVANASFLVNGAIALPARRKLTTHVADWANAEGRIVFVEGALPLTQAQGGLSFWSLLTRFPPLGWVVAHLVALGLIGSLARSVLFGRPRTISNNELERPSAHAEALGALLSRTGDLKTADSILETYRRWRNPKAAASESETSRRG